MMREVVGRRFTQVCADRKNQRLSAFICVQWWELAALAAILLLAGVLRMGWPGITEFKADEARLLKLALDFVEFKSFPLRGLGSSVGLPNSPVSVYLFALPLLAPFTRGPLAATLFVGVLNTASVLGAWWLGRRYFGPKAALFAALLYAASPWAAFYSRKIWAQNLLPLFVIAWAAAGLLAFVESRRRWIIPHLALLLLIVQIHLSGLALVPVTALALLIFRRRVDWRLALWGAGLAALTLAPIAVYVFIHRSELQATLGNLAGLTPTYSTRSLWMAWLTSTGANLHALAGPDAFLDLLATIPAPTPWVLLSTGFLALGLIALLCRLAQTPRGTRAGAAGFILLWLVVPVLFFVRETTPVFPHYFIVLYPAQYLAAGAALSALMDLAGRRLKSRRQSAQGRPPGRLRASSSAIPLEPAQAEYVPSVAAVSVASLPILLAAMQTWIFLASLNFVGERATPGAFGTPLGRQLAVVSRLRQEMGQHPGEEILIVSGSGDPDTGETPAVFEVLLRGLPLRFVDGNQSAVFPAQPAWVLVWPDGTLAEGAYHGGESIPLRNGEGAVRLVHLSGSEGAGVSATLPEPHLLANGVDLVRYELRGDFAPGGELLGLLWWRAGPPGPGDAYHFFNHLLAGDGGQVAGADGPGLPSGSWREGDLVVSYFSLQLPPGEVAGPFSLKVGMYSYPDLASVPVLDVAANPYADWVLAGPFP